MLVPSLARRIILPHGWPAFDEPGGADGGRLVSYSVYVGEARPHTTA
jgi:hypothetical protein